MAANTKSSRSAGCPLRKSDLCRAFLVLFPLCSPLNAQESTVAMKVDLVAWGDTITGLSLKSGEKQAVVSALSFRYSQPVSYAGPVILEIHKSGGGGNSSDVEISDADKEHEMKPLTTEDAKTDNDSPAKPKHGIALELEKRRQKDPTLVALAALPGTGCRRATVLLAPADGGTFTSYVIDDDPSKLPMGQLRIHNLSPIPIAMRCNGKQGKELKTSETFLVPAQNGQLIYELAYKLGDEWKIQENNIIPVRASEQTQMMVLKSDNSFFLSTDGSSGGFLQIVTLRR